MKPLAMDLFCGLGGWAEGLLAEGWDVVGFDIERHEYGEHRYPATLVLQDVLTLHGAQFRDATLIVASPPCQEFSYMAMPWSLAKAKAAAIRADTTGQMLANLTRLFDACFCIQREACEAAGRRIPTDCRKRSWRAAVGWRGASQLRKLLSVGRRAAASDDAARVCHCKAAARTTRQSVQILGHELVGPNQARAGFHADCRAASTERHQAPRQLAPSGVQQPHGAR